MSAAITRVKARACARVIGSAGSNGGVGKVSSSHSMIASDWVRTVPSVRISAGTKPCGFNVR
jgi:hypothetical protein